MKIKYNDNLPEMAPFVQNEINQMVKSRTLSSSLVNRSKIIQLAAQGLTNQQITSVLNIKRKNVGRWRRRFLEALPQINKLAEQDEQKACREAIIRTLSDKKRSGRPPKYSQEEQDAIIAAACTDPADFGIPIAQWNEYLGSG